MAKNGRPTKLTPDTQSKILEALRSGCLREDAARYAGIHPDTLSTWYRAGASVEAEDHLREFHREVQKTERSVKIRLLGIIQQAANEDWKAGAWYLERKFPDEFGRRDRLRLDGEHKIETTHVGSRIDALFADPTIAEFMKTVVGEEELFTPGDGNGNGNGNGNGS